MWLQMVTMVRPRSRGSQHAARNVVPQLIPLLARTMCRTGPTADDEAAGAAEDTTAVTAAPLRDLVTQLARTGRWRPGDADILVEMDSGYREQGHQRTNRSPTAPDQDL